MGTREGISSTKSAKPCTQQDHPSVLSYNEWAAAFQAYYGTGTTLPQPDYFPAAVSSSPQPHPYMWGSQPMMVPYGTSAHAAMYPYGGVYAHPALITGAHPYGSYAMPSPCTELAMAAAMTDVEVKSSEAKEHTASKQSKEGLGTLGMITGTGNERVKAASCSANGGHSQSCDSATEGSSEGSEEDLPQNDSKISLNQHSIDAYTGHPGDPYANSLGHTLTNPVNSAIASGKAPAGPPTNLNIGIDYWSRDTPMAVKGKHGSTGIPTSMMLVPSSSQFHEGMSSEQWLQDDKEVKRQRRKQSNRESARRSRLRKQAECEELSTRVDSLTAENSALRSELNQLAEQCKNLSSDNAALLENLQLRHNSIPGNRREQDVKIEKQHMQAEKNVLDQKKRRSSSHFALTNDARFLAAGILPLRGHSDVTAAG